jgi:hypothetical protein
VGVVVVVVVVMATKKRRWAVTRKGSGRGEWKWVVVICHRAEFGAISAV